MVGQHIVDVACKCWWQSDSSISPPPPSTLLVATNLPPQDTSNTSPTHIYNLPSFTAIHILIALCYVQVPIRTMQLLLLVIVKRWRGDVKSLIAHCRKTQVKIQILTTRSCCLWSTLNLLASLYPFRSSCSRPWSQPWKSLVNIFS